MLRVLPKMGQMKQLRAYLFLAKLIETVTIGETGPCSSCVCVCDLLATSAFECGLLDCVNQIKASSIWENGQIQVYSNLVFSCLTSFFETFM